MSWPTIFAFLILKFQQKRPRMRSLSVTQSVSVWGVRITSSEVILIQEEAGKRSQTLNTADFSG